MQIVQVTPRFPPAIGGLENHVYNISVELVERGHKVVVITSNDAEVDAVNEEVMNGIEVHRYPLFLPKLFREVWLIPSMVKLFHILQADIIHVHGYRCLSSFITAFLSERKGVPFVLTPHGIFPKRNRFNGLIKSVYDYSLGNTLLKSSDKVIALTESNKSLLLNLGASENKTVIIENGVDVTKYKELKFKMARKHGFSGPVLLYVGRIAWHKSLEKVIEALPSIVKDFHDARFLMVGPDCAKGSTDLLRLAKKLRVDDSVVMAGRVSESQLHFYYSIADVFILPSIYEGLSLSMLEAMASKVPLIVCSSTGISDVLTHGVDALILKSNTPSEISASVSLLLNCSELREKIRRNAHRLVLRKYTWKVVVDKLESIYEELVTAN